MCRARSEAGSLLDTQDLETVSSLAVHKVLTTDLDGVHSLGGGCEGASRGEKAGGGLSRGLAWSSAREGFERSELGWSRVTHRKHGEMGGKRLGITTGGSLPQEGLGVIGLGKSGSDRRKNDKRMYIPEKGKQRAWNERKEGKYKISRSVSGAHEQEQQRNLETTDANRKRREGWPSNHKYASRSCPDLIKR